MDNSVYKLLVVDDNEMNRDMLSRRLQRIGFQVRLAGDGHAALEALASEPFDLVLLDIMMPGMDGYQALEQMKQRPDWRAIPVIMLTAVQDKSQVLRCLKLGADNYVVKPFDMDALKNRIREALSKAAEKAASDDPVEPADATFKALQQRLKSGDLNFPTLPDIAFKMVALLEKEDVSIHEIAAIIKIDPAISTLVIKVANSAFYRGVSPISQVDDALARIGLNRITQSLMPLVTAGMFNAEAPLFHKLISQIWRHSLATGVYAKLIGKAIGYPNPEILFTLGMFHDIGRLFLIEVLQDLSKTRTIDDEAQVQALLDELHAPFGESLVKRWQLPNLFMDVVGQHHHTDHATDQHREIQIIGLADTIAYQQQVVEDQGDGECQVGAEQLVPLGLKPESLQQLVTNASTEIAAAKAAM